MLLNDDPGVIEAQPRDAPRLPDETPEPHTAESHWYWLLPWLLAFAGMLMTVLLAR
jgi:hypothetical protein